MKNLSKNEKIKAGMDWCSGEAAWEGEMSVIEEYAEFVGQRMKFYDGELIKSILGQPCIFDKPMPGEDLFGPAKQTPEEAKICARAFGTDNEYV